MFIEWKPLSAQQLNRLQNSSMDNLIESYKNGFRIESEDMLNIRSGGILKLGKSTCPTESQIVAGTTKTIPITLFGGTPPYTVNWKIDGILANSWKNISNEGIQTFDWTFNESLGSHIYLTEILDSCPTGIRSDSSSCTINIVQETTSTPTPEPTTSPTPEPTISPTPGPTTSPTPMPESACQNCDSIQNMCILNKCIPKDYLIYGGASLVLLLLITR